MGSPYNRKTALALCGGEDSDHPFLAEDTTYLDCCGLVRRVLRDLSDEFGFVIGPWNQAYQFETLCESELSSAAELQPGDLIFTQATFFDPARKKQRHDVTHVEIYLGPGGSTLGSRKLERVAVAEGEATVGPGGVAFEWTGAADKCGCVSVHPTHRFQSLSYQPYAYRFCSIKPWLSGDNRPRLTEWVGQFNGEWICEFKAGRKTGAANRSVFAEADEAEAGSSDGGSDD
eukprot:SAG22_NODE_959_length_6298_cov_3.186159_4_plen_231_part_00